MSSETTDDSSCRSYERVDWFNVFMLFKRILFIVGDLCIKCEDTEEAELLLSSC